MTVPYEDLDVGIRRLVRTLNDNGFKTCDSGDDRSKFDDGDPGEGLLNIPHVAMSCDAKVLVSECDRLRNLLQDLGIKVEQMSVGRSVCIQGSYEPGHGCLIMVLGADDSMLVED